MEVIYGLIPGMIILGVVAVAILFWAAKSGQFEDMDGEAYRILMDDDLESDKPADNSDADSSDAKNTSSKDD